MRGTHCPVCIRPAAGGVCSAHGSWQPHQLLTAADRRRSAREEWQPYEPAPHACPRCLGDVAPVASRFACVDHDHGAGRHGPYRVDELLGPSAQRESAIARSLLARRHQSRSRPRAALPIDVADPARAARMLLSAAVIAGTVAYLVR